MNSLIIENPTKLTDTSFKITINGNDYEYEISEEKDIDKVIEKLNTWIGRGPESFGGLYDYIKRTFQLVGEYQEPVEEEAIEDIEEGPSVEIPSDEKDIDEVEEDQLELTVNIEDDKVKISLEEWTGSFKVDDVEAFTDTINEYTKDEMTLKDRTELAVQLIKIMDADDMTDFYNLINLLLNTEVDIVDSLDKIEEEPIEEPVNEPTEEPETSEEPSETGEPEEETPEETREESVEVDGNILQEDDNEFNLYSDEEELVEETAKLTIDDLIKDETFLNDLIDLDLSFFKITKEDEVEHQVIYFIGGINEVGNKFSLSYSTEKPIELLGQFDDLKDLNVCLNNIEDLNTVVDYISKLNEIVYNKEMEGADNE